jgi:collagenase-like PrtC family protease
MERVELLLPAGDKESLRTACANGADAVYLGLDRFNARRYAANFPRRCLPGIVRFCHGKGVKVFVTANTLVKNGELADYLDMVGVIGRSGADAVIIQDPCLAGLIRECAPGCGIHLSTQATTTNSHAIPKGVDRVIVSRELGLDEIAAIARLVPAEMFVHGALCLSYSGQCLFSSMAGGRSGNRGRCAQPCRQSYNGSYPLSTRDLCLLEKLPDIIQTGVVALKVEGRMRGPLYTGVVARIYKKYIDRYYTGAFRVDARDIDELKMAFNREFTTGFAFNDSVVDSRWPHNRGLFLGFLRDGKLRLEADLRTGDGVSVFHEGKKSGNTVRTIRSQVMSVDRARRGETVTVEVRGAREGDSVYKTFSADLKVDMGADFEMSETDIPARPFKLPAFSEKKVLGPPMLFVKVHDMKGAREADRAGAEVIYYDIFNDDRESARQQVAMARFFLAAPRVLSDGEVKEAFGIIGDFKPDGVLVGERGLLSMLKKTMPSMETHLDMSFNVFNDIDLACWPGIPIISPELTFREMADLRSRDFIVMVHGPLALMTTKEPIKDKTLRDFSGRVFRTRRMGGLVQILNCSDLGLFNKVEDLLGAGMKWFFLDPEGKVGRTVDIYKRILSGKRFNDRNARHGHTTGHFGRGVD